MSVKARIKQLERKRDASLVVVTAVVEPSRGGAVIGYRAASSQSDLLRLDRNHDETAASFNDRLHRSIQSQFGDATRVFVHPSVTAHKNWSQSA